jgi:pyruvate,orthophosphate dikinase
MYQENIQGMHAAKGILTARGGMTSHAAVVARGMGRPCRPCVSGSSEIDINYEQKIFKTENKISDLKKEIKNELSDKYKILDEIQELKEEESDKINKNILIYNEKVQLKMRIEEIQSTKLILENKIHKLEEQKLKDDK